MSDQYKSFENLSIDIYQYVKDYREILNTDPYNAEKIQDIRDAVSECLVLASKQYADLKSQVAVKEYHRKKCERDVVHRVRGEMEYARGSDSIAKNKAAVECDNCYKEEIDAIREYEEAKQLVESVNQHLNSISSRLRVLSKYE